ncbi:MAG TPA: hemerythrin domain-containing protein [Micromonosporaceae bacterium]|nr:hemerythrin domain-containing protein [Micromonosporaceae bacterium]
MRDITDLIMDDHTEMRRQFADLDDAATDEQAGEIWANLSVLLDLHAATEEAVFYPELLRHAAEAEEETDDAIRDHNAIRDAIAAAKRAPVGSDQWWAAVHKAREENDEHMSEEENEVLPDFRHSAPDELRLELGARFLAFKAAHPGGQGADTRDKDPKAYIESNW